MKLSELKTQSEAYTDEIMTSAFALAYANKAIAYINTEISIELPFFANVDDDYDALTDAWLMRLVTPYLAYGIKMNDTSLSEANRYEQEFAASLIAFKEVFADVIDAEYLTDNASNIWQGSARNVNSGWFPGY